MKQPEKPADWLLPPGVDHGLWDYIHDPNLARSYDASLGSSLLFHTDLRFAEKHMVTPGRALDLGCGTGRALVYFAERGHQMVGVDLSREMLKEASLKRSADLQFDLLQMNLTDLGAFADQSFDYVLSLFSTLGMVVGSRQRARACAEMHRVLKPGGALILHVHNRWHNLRDRQGRRWLIGNLWRGLLGREWYGDCVMPPHQGLGEITLHLFTRREISKLLRRTGFRIVEIQPLSLTGNGLLKAPWLAGRLRAYGYLLVATRPS